MKNKTKILAKIAITFIILSTILIITFAITFTVAYYQIKEDYGKSAEINSFAFSFHHLLAFYGSYQDTEYIVGKSIKVNKPIVWGLHQAYSLNNDDVEKIINTTKVNFLATNLFSNDGLPTQIKSFPMSTQFNSLIYLDASWSRLAAIPKKINKFTKLEFLGFQSCPITQLPKEIGQLSSLRYLNLSRCNITQLPKEIGQLSSLRYLNLSHCNITQLPKEIGQLSSLRYLNLSHCNITQLPKEIGQLSSLKYLDLSWCRLTEIPKEIAQLSSLKGLSLCHNKFIKIPKEIAQLPSLEALDLSECELTKIPDAVYSIQHLKNLLLIRNKITKLPEVKKFRNFLQLNLAANPIAKTKLPDELVYPYFDLFIPSKDLPPIKIILKEDFEDGSIFFGTTLE